MSPEQPLQKKTIEHLILSCKSGYKEAIYERKIRPLPLNGEKWPRSTFRIRAVFFQTTSYKRHNHIHSTKILISLKIRGLSQGSFFKDIKTNKTKKQNTQPCSFILSYKVLAICTYNFTCLCCGWKIGEEKIHVGGQCSQLPGQRRPTPMSVAALHGGGMVNYFTPWTAVGRARHHP